MTTSFFSVGLFSFIIFSRPLLWMARFQLKYMYFCLLSVHTINNLLIGSGNLLKRGEEEEEDKRKCMGLGPAAVFFHIIADEIRNHGSFNTLPFSLGFFF